MSDQCIIHGCTNRKNQGTFIGDICLPCSNMLVSGDPKFGVTFVHKMRDRIEELEAKLAKAEVLQEAQKLFNYYAVEIVTYGATVARLQNLENAWLNLKTQAELTGGKDGT